MEGTGWYRFLVSLLPCGVRTLFDQSNSLERELQWSNTTQDIPSPLIDEGCTSLTVCHGLFQPEWVTLSICGWAGELLLMCHSPKFVECLS